jgi:membrane-associated HD superfamily phosphohydrolase
MARKAGLPEPFIDVIKEHHGTGVVWFFYKAYLDKMGLKSGDGDIALFRYAGPKPQSKEAAIIMLADAFEAASRSLDHVDEDSLSELLDKIVQTKVEDHQLDECPLTYQEMAIVKKTLMQTLLAAAHVRVKYPPKE